MKGSTRIKISKLFMVFAIMLAIACKNAAAQTEEKKSNVIFIALDDLNHWIGCMGGHPQVQSSHMDRLASKGMLFNNAHCQPPVSNPFRASIMTSLYLSSSGI